jgi:hypothetical protein
MTSLEVLFGSVLIGVAAACALLVLIGVGLLCLFLFLVAACFVATAVLVVLAISALLGAFDQPAV